MRAQLKPVTAIFRLLIFDGQKMPKLSCKIWAPAGWDKILLTPLHGYRSKFKTLRPQTHIKLGSENPKSHTHTHCHLRFNFYLCPWIQFFSLFQVALLQASSWRTFLWSLICAGGPQLTGGTWSLSTVQNPLSALYTGSTINNQQGLGYCQPPDPWALRRWQSLCLAEKCHLKRCRIMNWHGKPLPTVGSRLVGIDNFIF